MCFAIRFAMRLAVCDFLYMITQILSNQIIYKMSLLKWKEMAEKRSKLGQKINAVKETIKQKNISDSIGDVQAEKLFKPITSGIKDLARPKIRIRRLPIKKNLFPIMDLKQEMMKNCLIMV